jgi:hypothetical protein
MDFYTATETKNFYQCEWDHYNSAEIEFCYLAKV